MATEVATLQFKADTTELKSANAELAKTEQAGVRAEDAAKRMGAQLKNAANDSINPIKKVTAGISGLQSALIAIAGSVVVGQIVSIANQFTDLNSRLINATGSTEAANQAFKAITQTARGTYSSIQQTAQAFLLNSMALNELGFSTKEQIDLADALNNALVISGTKGDQAASVMNALSKAMALGKLSGDNFNTVIQSGGRVVQALADGLGVTTSELRSMAADGLLTTEVLVKSLTGEVSTLRREAAAMPATIADGMVLFKNSMFGLIGTLNEVSGVSQSVSGLIVGIADSVQSFTNRIVTARERQQEFNEVFEELSTLTTTGYVPALDEAINYVNRLIGSKLDLIDATLLENRSITQNQEVIDRINVLYGEASRQRQQHNLIVGEQNALSAILNARLAEQAGIVTEVTAAVTNNNGATEASISLASQVMASIADEIYMLTLSNRERALRANLIALGNDASPAEVAAIVAATNALYDERDALAALNEVRAIQAGKGTKSKVDEQTEADREAALERFETIVKYNKMESDLKDKANKQQLDRQREQTNQLLAFEDVLLQGKNSALGEAYRIGVNYADKEKRETAGKIIMKSYEAAMNAYASLSAVPFIGPALGAAAAATIIAAGASYSAKSLAGRALGGQVRGGESYVVGERGPEILTMGSASGKIIPNSSITQAQATGTINNTANVTFSITANDTRGFDELLLKRRGMIASLVQSSLNNLGRSI
jgi:tape measure domain-containing protein